MQQLSGMDAAFLYFESGNAPTHIGSFAIYDQSTAPGGFLKSKEREARAIGRPAVPLLHTTSRGSHTARPRRTQWRHSHTPPKAPPVAAVTHFAGRPVESGAWRG